MKPLIKWVGGKRQIVSILKNNAPDHFNRYIEPFFGGGALFFALERKYCYLSDLNSELINFYKIVRDRPADLINDLNLHRNNKEYFLKIRSIDRDLAPCPVKFLDLSAVKRASRFLYLNKTGFNGLYRVNKKGCFNVPFAHHKTFNLLPVDDFQLLKHSELLKGSELINCSFEKLYTEVKKGDFVYFDPPYDLINKNSFVSYTDQKFLKGDHSQLKLLCDYIHSIGAFFMLSNSDTYFIRSLFRNYKIITIQSKRSINCNAKKRGLVEELLIKNYN